MKNKVETVKINKKLKRVGAEDAHHYTVFNQSKRVVYVLARRLGEKKRVTTTIPPESVRTFDSLPTIYGEVKDQIVCVVSYYNED